MKMKLDEITPHPQNKEIYSISNLSDLVESIKDVGLLEPIVINQKNQILSGNRRYEAIKQLNWKEVEVLKLEVKSKEDPKYLVHFNKHRIKTFKEILNESKVLEDYYGVLQNTKGKVRDQISNDLNIGSSTLGKLKVVEKFDKKLIDLIDKEILTVAQAYLQVQRVNKEKKSIKSKKRTVTNSKDFIFYEKSSENMSEIKDGVIQTIFTSPPYWNKRKYSHKSSLGEEKYPQDFVINLTNHLQDCFRVLSKRGSFFLNLGDTFLNGNLQNIPHKVAINLQESGWILRNTIIWSKTNPKPSSSKSNLCPSYEYIFHFVKSNDYLYNQTLAPLKDSTKASLPPRHKSIKTGKVSSSPYIPREGKNMGDYWSEDIVRTAVVNQKLTTNNNEHPAPFNEHIVTLPILQTSNEDDLVLDPFMGVGTTGKVANKLNRKFIGYDVKCY
jgi:ParB/RepB/Spo0J family partition protein